MRRPARVASLLTVAAFLLQVSWALAVPPFRGIDEFDHAYRAAAVAHGDYIPTSAPVDGRGAYVSVPRDIVEAATAVCEGYQYTGPANCRPGRVIDGDLVQVASGAARYNPVFYWLIGQPAQFFEGTANVYALRAFASLLCLLFFWLAAYALASSFRTRWPLVALVVTVTPVFAYSTMLGAPNGVEMTAALGVWCTLVALGVRGLGHRHERVLLLIGTLAAAVLVTPRLLGPLWLAMIGVAVVFHLGRSRVGDLLKAHRSLLLAAGATIAASSVAALVWNRLAAPNALSAEEHLGLTNPVGNALATLPLWVFQSIGAFPSKDEPAPPVVYAAVFLMLGLLTFAASRGVTRCWWLALAALVLAWAGVQLAITIATFEQLGAVWQGRYALPFGAGIPVLMAALSDRAGVRAPGRVVGTLTAGLLLVGHTVAVVDVYLAELAKSPFSGTPAWLEVPTAVLVVLVGLAAAVTMAALTGACPEAEPDPPVKRQQLVPAR